MRQCIVDRSKQPAVAETIRSNIQNAHDERSLTMGISKFLTFQTNVLGRRWIPAGNRRQQRLLDGFADGSFELWTIRSPTIGNRRILVERQAGDDPSNLDAVERLTLQQAFRPAGSSCRDSLR
jgi:hypothetical protein